MLLGLKLKNKISNSSKVLMVKRIKLIKKTRGKSLWSEEDTNLYQQEGLSLWHQLHQELTPEYKVYYFSDRRFL